MYKLVFTSGPNRGSGVGLQTQPVSIGRAAGNDLVLASGKISKRHCRIALENGIPIVRDSGSANGTFVNGELVTVRVLSLGDRLSVGGYILELIESAKSQPPVALQGFNPEAPAVRPNAQLFAGEGESGPSRPAPPPPQGFLEKLNFYFEERILPPFLKLNQTTQWRFICLFAVLLFVLVNLLITVYPILGSGRQMVINETQLRAQFMAHQIAATNAPILAAHTETKADLGQVPDARGVRLAVLCDLDSRIIAPGSQLNQYLGQGEEASFAIHMRDLFRADEMTGGRVKVVGDSVIAIEPVEVVSTSAGKNVAVAMAIVTLDLSLNMLDTGEMLIIYAETLILTGIFGFLLFYLLYRITLRPLQTLSEDMNSALKGDRSDVSQDYQWEEIAPLWDLINSALQRLPRTEGAANLGGFGNTPSESVEDLVPAIQQLGEKVPVGMVLCDSERRVLTLNNVFEELSGIRAEGALGQTLASVARDESLGSLIEDLFGRASPGSELVTEDYEFSGTLYQVSVTAFGTPGRPARAHLLIAVRAVA